MAKVLVNNRTSKNNKNKSNTNKNKNSKNVKRNIKKVPKRTEVKKIQKKENVKNVKGERDNKKVNVKQVNNVKENKSKNNVDNKENKKNRESKENRRNKKYLVLFFCIIALVITLVYLAFTLVIFNVKKINVYGNSKYSASEIINASSFKTNENIFYELLKYKNTTIDLAFVASFDVSIKFPDEINLSVTERTSMFFAYDKEKDKFFRLDSDGYILEEVSQSEKEKGETLVYGITFDNNVVLGSKINEVDLSKLKVYEKIAKEYAKRDFNGDITRVNFENSLTTITLNDKLNVVLPNDTDLDYKLDLLKSILNENTDLEGVIDMTKDNPVYSKY